MVAWHGEYDARLVDCRRQVFGLLQVEREGLVANDVEAAFDRGLGDFVVRVVRRRDGDEVDAVVQGPLRLAGDHLLIRAVRPVRRDVVIGRARLGLRGVGRQRPGDHGRPVVQTRGDRMHAANERPLAAADQAHA